METQLHQSCNLIGQNLMSLSQKITVRMYMYIMSQLSIANKYRDSMVIILYQRFHFSPIRLLQFPQRLPLAEWVSPTSLESDQKDLLVYNGS